MGIRVLARVPSGWRFLCSASAKGSVAIECSFLGRNHGRWRILWVSIPFSARTVRAGSLGIRAIRYHGIHCNHTCGLWIGTVSATLCGEAAAGGLTPRWSVRVRDNVPSSYNSARRSAQSLGVRDREVEFIDVAWRHHSEEDPVPTEHGIVYCHSLVQR